MKAIAPTAASAAAAAAAAATIMRQEGASCSYYYGCNNRSSNKSSDRANSCALTRVRVICGASSPSRCCGKLGGSKGFGMQISGDDFRECVIKQSVVRKETCRSSRPGSTCHASYGVATRRHHEDSTNRGGASYLDQLENISGGISNNDMQLDCWVEDAVFEIVKNVDQAPFLQFVFETHDRSSERSKRQQVSQEVFEKPECWLQLQDSLSRGAVPPDGVIFVQRLDVTSCCLEEEENPAAAAPWGSDQRWKCPLEEDPAAGAAGDAASFRNDRRRKCPLEVNGSCTNMWGVIVQARSAHANACYILKTTKVCSSAGLCTQFCLTRAKCFGPSIAAQLERVWLL